MWTEAFPPPYIEARTEAERKLAQEQEAMALRHQQNARQVQAQEQSKAPQRTTATPATSMAQALQAPSRQQSGGVLGAIVHDLYWGRASATSSAASSCVPSRTQTPAMPVKTPEHEKREAEARAAERDTGICTLPSWH